MKGTITIKNQRRSVLKERAHTLKVTSNKRELIYNNNVLYATKPITFID